MNANIKNGLVQNGLMIILVFCTTISCAIFQGCGKNMKYITNTVNTDTKTSDHIRIVSWNIEHLGKRSPLRTSDQRKLVGERMLDMDAVIFLLQEIKSDNAFSTVVNQMNEFSSDNWVSYRNNKQNALVYNASKLEIIEAPNHWTKLDNSYYPQSGSRPPVTVVFKAIGSINPIRVIGIHADPYNEQTRIAQAKWLNDKILGLLSSPEETHNIILCGDYNTGGNPKDGLLQVFVDNKIIFNVPKENGPGTGWETREESDYFSATSFAMAKIKSGICFVHEPEVFNETYVKFEETYSDHYPVSIDYIFRRDNRESANN